jgi:hypothetical protein
VSYRQAVTKSMAKLNPMLHGAIAFEGLSGLMASLGRSTMTRPSSATGTMEQSTGGTIALARIACRSVGKYGGLCIHDCRV